MYVSPEKHILDSWHKNVNPWVKAIQEEQIPSRVLVTNQAIVDAIQSCNPGTALDLGCGEGWLVRAMQQMGVNAMGVDAIPGLIEAAQKLGPETYQVLAYEDLSYNQLQRKFDLIVCNFSLFGKESVAYVFQQIPDLLRENGAFLIQTLHPKSVPVEDYVEGWRSGSWTGFDPAFTDPAPWYFRTLESWQALFTANNLQLEMMVPSYPDTGKPASLILKGTR